MNSDLILSLSVVCISICFLLYGWIRYRSNPSPARVSKEGGTFLLSERVMSVAYYLVTPLTNVLAKRNIHPDLLTWLSLPLGVLSGYAVATGRWSLAALLLMLSGLCDMLDGAVARKLNKDRPSGAVLDSLLDRYVEFFVLMGVIVHFIHSTELVVLTFCALFGSLLVTYSTAKAEALRMRVPRGFMKRPERMAYLIVGFLVTPLFPFYDVSTLVPVMITIGLIACFANLSAMLRMRAIYKQTYR